MFHCIQKNRLLFIVTTFIFHSAFGSAHFIIAEEEEIVAASPKDKILLYQNTKNSKELKGGGPGWESNFRYIPEPENRRCKFCRKFLPKFCCAFIPLSLFMSFGIYMGSKNSSSSPSQSPSENGPKSPAYSNNSSSTNSTNNGASFGPKCLNASDPLNITGQSWDAQMLLPNTTSGEKSLATQTNLCPIEGATNSSSLIAYVQSKNPNATNICVSKTNQTNPCTQYTPQAKRKPIKTLLKRNYSRYQLKQPRGKR